MRRKVFRLGAAVIGTLAITAACVHQPAGSGTGSAASVASHSATAPAPALAATASANAARACGTRIPLTTRTLTVTLTDNDKTICVTTGTTVQVFLQGTLSSKWTPVHSGSSALVPKADPRLMLRVGVTGAAFEAVRPGVAILSSARHSCRPDASAGSAATTPSASSANSCGVMLAFRVTLVVKAQ